MRCCIAELRCKEVINVCDGTRLGYVEDVLIQLPEGKVVALVVPGDCRFLGLFGREEDIVIPWECVTRMGDDIILAEVKRECLRERRRRGREGFFSETQ